MTNEEFRTLAYAKSPKTSRRTTFQDELQVAVSARASKSKADHYCYPDDFDDDEDDFLNKLLESRKKKTDAFKAGRSKGRINDFDISDDEDKHGKKKKVSFLKTQRISFPSENTSKLRENEPPDSSAVGHNNNNNIPPFQNSTTDDENDTLYKNSVVASPQTTRQSSSKSLSYQTSDDTVLDMPLPLPSDSGVTETPDPDEKSDPLLEESSQLPHLLADSATNQEPPKPKPRQRTVGLSFHTTRESQEEAITQDFSRPQSDSASIPLPDDTTSITAVRSCTPHFTEDNNSISNSLSKSSGNKSEQSQLSAKSTFDSGSRGDPSSDDSKEEERKYSTSFEEFNEELGHHSDNSVAQLTHTLENSFDTGSKVTRRCQSAFSRKVESKYLGTLKVLDHNVSLQGSLPQGADSLRAAIYQEWLEKKKEKLRENMQLKKKEELLQEKKKKEDEAKKEDAVVSYVAWKEKKAEDLKAKVKEKQDMMRKEQRASQEKEEKRQSAKQVFEKWKQEHDHLLKEKYRKHKQAESKLSMKKQKKEEERKRECASAFTTWCEKKKNLLHEKAMTEHKKIKNKSEEERYMKEERDKMALDIYENWLMRKDLEQKRQREERRIKAILQDSPPPPWSPPNKTISFHK